MKTRHMEEWSQQLSANGRVELRQSRLSLIPIFLLSLLFTGFGIAMIFSDERSTLLVVMAVIIIGFFGVYSVPSLIRQYIRGGNPVVVDDAGVHVPGKPLIPWSEIAGVGVSDPSEAQSVVLGVSPEFLRQFHAGDRHGDTAARPATDATGMGEIHLPHSLRGDAELLATWIGLTAHRRRVSA